MLNLCNVLYTFLNFKLFSNIILLEFLLLTYDNCISVLKVSSLTRTDFKQDYV